MLPIVATPPSNLTEAQFEAEEYDDGFAQIVHSNQPTTIDAATLDATQIPPATDAGIQLGWDDEQVTVWFNNQVDLLRYRLDPTSVTPPPAEAPLGVIGYRVDVRIKGTTTWQSLCEVNGTLPFNQSSLSGTTSISGNEFWIAPAPIRRSSTDNTTNDQPAWLPLYFAQWAAFSQTNTGTALPSPPTLPNPNPDLTAVPNLVYGNPYEFRVRLVDITGGGPLASRRRSPATFALSNLQTLIRCLVQRSCHQRSRPGRREFRRAGGSAHSRQRHWHRRNRSRRPRWKFSRDLHG